MKLYIPDASDVVTLKKTWTFKLYGRDQGRPSPLLG